MADTAKRRACTQALCWLLDDLSGSRSSRLRWRIFWDTKLEIREASAGAAWDPASHLSTAEDVAAYLEAALQDGDPQIVAAALGDLARAKGMSQIARDAGLGRESLYKSLSSSGNPELATVLRVISIACDFGVGPAIACQRYRQGEDGCLISPSRGQAAY
jgi:probable addiction module antidote protein